MLSPARLSYAFLGSFLFAVFLLQYWQRASYPLALWFALGTVAMSGCIGFLGFLGQRKAERGDCTERALRFPVQPGTVRRYCGAEPSAFQRSTTLFGFVVQAKAEGEATGASEGRTAQWSLLPIAIGISLALWTVSHHVHVPSPATIDWYADGREVVLTGMVMDLPDRRAAMTRYRVEARALEHPTHPSIPVHGTVLVTDWGGWPAFAYGDLLNVRGALERPGPIDDVAWDRHLARSGIHSVLKSAQIERLGSGYGWRISAALMRLRMAFEVRINRLFPEPHASFLAGLLLGSRRGMSPHVTETLQATGLSHIIAVSGYNITILMNVAAVLLVFIPAHLRMVLTITGIIGYVLLIGSSPSAVRAAIMGILGLVALKAGRAQMPRLVLLWTAFLMLLWNPLLLWYDAGFQLSFLAVIGLIEVGPLLRPLLRRVPRTLALKDTLLMTLAAQVFTLPWVASLFGRIALISPLSNVLVAPLIPAAMLFGFIGTTINIIVPGPGQVIAYAGWACLEMMLHIADILARLPLASLTIRHLSPLFIAFLYASIATVLFYCHRYTNTDVSLPNHGSRSSRTARSPGSLNERDTMTVPD